MIDTSAVPNWPVVHIALGEDGSLTVDGEPVELEAGQNARSAALDHAARLAGQLGRAVRVDAQEPDGTLFRLVVDDTGAVVEAGPPVLPGTNRRRIFGRGRGRRAADDAGRGAAAFPPPPRNENAPQVPAAPYSVEAPTSAPMPVEIWEADAVAPVRDGLVRVEPLVAHPIADEETPEELGIGSNPIPPHPTPEQEAVLQRVRRFADAGDPENGLALLPELEATAIGRQVPALREVRAYLTLVDGQPDIAMQLYLWTLDDLAGAPEGPEDRERVRRWAQSVLECAHHCWLQLGAPDEVFAFGKDLVGQYEAWGLAESPGARAARRRQKETNLRRAVANGTGR